MNLKEGEAARLAKQLARKYPDACRERLVSTLRTLGSVVGAYDESPASQALFDTELTFDQILHNQSGYKHTYKGHGGRVGDLVPSQ